MKYLRFILLIPLAFLLSGSVTTNMLQVLARKNVAAGDNSPGTTNLVAWYDFDDATDSHNDGGNGPYNLTEEGGPITYTSGVYINDSSDDRLVHTTLDNNWHTSDGDATVFIRMKADANGANANYPLWIKDGYVQHRWYRNISTNKYEICNISIDSGDTGSVGTWYLVVIRYDSTTDDVDVLVNNVAPTTSTGNGVFATTGGDLRIPSTAGADFSVDYMAFYEKRLTDAECTWLYNSDSTRTYADL